VANNVVPSASEKSLSLQVAVGECFSVYNQDGIVCRFKKGLELGFALLERRFRSLALGDVLNRADQERGAGIVAGNELALAA
jgi:hypothetical protein